MKQALVVDDHPIVRDGIKELLQKAFPSVTIKDSSGADGLLDEVCSYPWAFVVLDINIPGQNGLDIIKKTKARRPEIPIIVFSLYPERQYAARALRAGAAAYLSKERPPGDLVEIAKSILEGGAIKKPREVLVSQPLLSDREVQVLSLFVRGLSRKEISQELNINEKTVSTYRARLLHKLGVRNLVELIRYAVEEGLVD
ncbi:MAG TPA: response regulator transcription factor [Nitrospira sp.]|nr:response regulator transcription factor [Nitrospira sp.]